MKPAILTDMVVTNMIPTMERLHQQQIKIVTNATVSKINENALVCWLSFFQELSKNYNRFGLLSWLNGSFTNRHYKIVGLQNVNMQEEDGLK
mgnify:CR=1 FL=1